MLQLFRHPLSRLPAALVVLVVSAGQAAAFWDPVTAKCTGIAVTGHATAVDGETLRLVTGGGVRVIRLVGLQAPDLLQACRDADGIWSCGIVARRTLQDLVAGRELVCTPCGTAHDGATIAQCLSGKLDIGVALVKTGMATGSAFFNIPLRSATIEAEAAGRGLWRGDWVDPGAWRDGVRLGPGPCKGCVLPR